jgi:hypothetical protein
VWSAVPCSITSAHAAAAAAPASDSHSQSRSRASACAAVLTIATYQTSVHGLGAVDCTSSGVASDPTRPRPASAGPCSEAAIMQPSAIAPSARKATVGPMK